MKSEEAKVASDDAIKIFCLTTFFFSMGFLLIPMLIPLIMTKLSFSGAIISCVMATPCIMLVISTPILHRVLPCIGMERSILISNISYAIGTIAIGFGTCIQN